MILKPLNRLQFRVLVLNWRPGARCLHTSLFYCNENHDPKAREQAFERDRLRNIGIVAHINAGKTTTTERILYYSGSTSTPGDVDKGNTVTDYLEQERDRGITISSASVSFNWRGNRVNLIDTPGHVDFTIEVERSLAVVDGVVTILDASAGVEAQTVTVWHQAAKYQLPQLVFLNKCDKPQADYRMCMQDISESLGGRVALLQVPVEMGAGGGSLADIVERTLISWEEPAREQGSVFRVEPLEASEVGRKQRQLVEEERERLVNALADLDDELASSVIECDSIGQVPADSIKRAVRRATLGCQLCPVLAGSSFRYMGVQQLLEAMVTYLPSPVERARQVRRQLTGAAAGGRSPANSAFIFKVTHDSRLGPLSYLRVLSGSVARGQRLETLGSRRAEQIRKVHRVFADELEEMTRPAQADEIVVASGLSEARTGDILVDPGYQSDELADTSHQKLAGSNLSDSSSQKLADCNLSDSSGQKLLDADQQELPFQLLGEVVAPRIAQLAPVYFCSIEAASTNQQARLEAALAKLAREDPSFGFQADGAGGTCVRGMGRLHLEVARDRLESEHRVQAHLGPLQVAYLESIGGEAVERLAVERVVGGQRNAVSLSLRLRPAPSSGVWSAKRLRLSQQPSGERPLEQLRSDHRRALELGLLSGLASGPARGFPLVDLDITLLGFEANARCSLPVIAAAASQCLAGAVRRAQPQLLEPVMLVEVLAPVEAHGLLLGELARRHAQLLGSTGRAHRRLLVRAHAPLAQLAELAEWLRVATSGRAAFSMRPAGYAVAVSSSLTTGRHH